MSPECIWFSAEGVGGEDWSWLGYGRSSFQLMKSITLKAALEVNALAAGRRLHRVDFWLTLAKEKWKMVVTIEEDGTPSASRQKKRQLKMRLRLCEICGKTAENVSGIRDNRFMEEWNGKVPACASTSLSEGNDCWNRPPLCNMLTSCLVMAFIQYMPKDDLQKISKPSENSPGLNIGLINLPQL
ncbi:hypothetical protein MLD38_028481 [Melastoma candidum]|uniref:Uncharacterized protein n=1 Tax=Melastoma candidum TaxID=119954 RepID=A0ACB9N0U5_9MYRT|nr:hypothetical protein MLD38_028481 [Melastoma candidum]